VAGTLLLKKISDQSLCLETSYKSYCVDTRLRFRNGARLAVGVHVPKRVRVHPIGETRVWILIPDTHERTSVRIEKGAEMKALMHFLRDESGQDMVEYGLLAAFISIVAIAALRAIGPLVTQVYQNVQAALT
jgi:pilus assembly protein Flp/PilA